MPILFTDYVKAIIELGFPVAVAIYLLIYQSKQMERVNAKLTEVKIGLYLILRQLDIFDDFDKAVKELKAKDDDNE